MNLHDLAATDLPDETQVPLGYIRERLGGTVNYADRGGVNGCA